LSKKKCNHNNREKLVRFQSFVYLFERPPFSLKSMIAPSSDSLKKNHIHGCYQNFLKIHPEHDPVIGETLRRDPRGLLGIIDSGKAN